MLYANFLLPSEISKCFSFILLGILLLIKVNFVRSFIGRPPTRVSAAAPGRRWVLPLDSRYRLALPRSPQCAAPISNPGYAYVRYRGRFPPELKIIPAERHVDCGLFSG